MDIVGIDCLGLHFKANGSRIMIFGDRYVGNNINQFPWNERTEEGRKYGEEKRIAPWGGRRMPEVC